MLEKALGATEGYVTVHWSGLYFNQALNGQPACLALSGKPKSTSALAARLGDPAACRQSLQTSREEAIKLVNTLHELDIGAGPAASPPKLYVPRRCRVAPLSSSSPSTTFRCHSSTPTICVTTFY